MIEKEHAFQTLQERSILHEDAAFLSDTKSDCIESQLFALQDVVYKDFNKKLIPTVPEETMIGIRVPVLRTFAKRFFKIHRKEVDIFMDALPHRYFEENNLHAFFIECLEDIDAALCALEAFLLFIDNWQTCDICSPPVLKKYPDAVYQKILQWLRSAHPYTVRYAIGLLLSNYLNKHFRLEMLELVSGVRSDEYYVNMMIAWYFSTALVKQYAAAVPYIENKLLLPFTHNKAIQKAIESRCIPSDIKAYLRTMKLH